MKTIKLTKPERQKLITDKLKEYPALRVSELSQDIGVSTETIRRDLDELESLGLISRTYGGAAPAITKEPSFKQREMVNVKQYEIIARATCHYINDGEVLAIGSSVTTLQVATLNWSTEEAQKRMENLISSVGYGPDGVKLDVVLSSNDSVANGVTNALTASGYNADNFPLLTGQDCDKPSVKNMKRGLQTMSVFKDTRVLADQVVKMVNAIVDNKEVPVNDTKTYNNGTGVIPSYLCSPIVVTKDNLKEVLIDSGYYTEKEVK